MADFGAEKADFRTGRAEIRSDGNDFRLCTYVLQDISPSGPLPNKEKPLKHLEFLTTKSESVSAFVEHVDLFTYTRICGTGLEFTQLYK